MTGERVLRILDGVIAARGLPAVLTADNGPELASQAMEWIRGTDAASRSTSSRPGSRGEWVYRKVNGTFRDELLSLHWFVSLADAHFHIERQRIDYNGLRPHQSLKVRTPPEFARIAQHTPCSTTLTPGLLQQVA